MGDESGCVEVPTSALYALEARCEIKSREIARHKAGRFQVCHFDLAIKDGSAFRAASGIVEAIFMRSMCNMRLSPQ